MDYCDRELTYALKEVGYPIRPIPIGGARAGIPIYYDLPIDHPDWRDCDAYHAPSLWQVDKWLRRRNLFVHISYPLKVQNDVFWNYDVLDGAWSDEEMNPPKCASGGLCDTYEEALQKGIKEAVKILKEEK